MDRNAQLQILQQYMDDNQQYLYDQLSALVQIDTVNSITTGNENQGQDHMERICRELGMQVHRFTPDSVAGVTENPDYRPGRAGDRRENLVALFPGRSQQRIMLAAHIDTMPLGDPDTWYDSPLSGTIRDGYIFGRGAGDDKSGLAAAWFLLKALKDCQIQPSAQLLLGSYVDEEYGGGNGALAMAIQYPCDCVINLDSPGFETEAFGGSCYRLKLQCTKNDKSIVSVFDVFTGLNLIKEALAALNTRKGVHIRLSSAEAGVNGGKDGGMHIAVYTDRTLSQTQSMLDELLCELRPALEPLNLATDGFIRTTRYFHYGKTAEDCPQVQTMRAHLRERLEYEPDTAASCLSDLSLFLRYSSPNSFNFGVPRGNGKEGGAHQCNEQISCQALLQLAKDLIPIVI